MNEWILVKGKIVATQLGTFGSTAKVYGYVVIRKGDGKDVKVKVDSRTEYDSLSVGDSVEVYMVELGETGILLARRVILNSGPFYTTGDESVEVSA